MKNNAFTRQNYYHEYLKKKGVNLNEHLDITSIEPHTTIPYQEIINWTNENLDKAIKVGYVPRPYSTDDNIRQAVMLQHMGFNEHNTTNRNWGLDDEDNEKLIEMLGDSFFEDINIDKTKCLVRVLRYDPGHGIPLHSDGFGGFTDKFGEGNAKRYFVAVSPWDWGHFFQLHDNMIHHWNPGYTVEVPYHVFHCSGNCGISPKYTLTVTGFTK